MLSAWTPPQWCLGGSPMLDDRTQSAVDAARELLSRSSRVVALTGAGISTDSGIPDFRGPSGIWTKDPSAERLATLQAYVEEPEIRRRAWQNRVDSPTWRAQPNAGHRALVELEQRGILTSVITQNVDGLHLAAGHDPSRIIEIHGTMREVVCLSCGHRQPAQKVLDRVQEGEDDPACLETLAAGERCGGILKSATISFGQQLVPADVQRAEEAAAAADVLLAIGSTLSVYPAAGLVPLAARGGAAIVIINAQPTAYDDLADIVIQGSISELLPATVRPA